MILSIGSSIPTFKTLQFHAGLNILLADASDGTSHGKTRNSAGKSSFVLIVDFLLGANCDRKSVFRTPELIDATFSARFKFGDDLIQIERTGSDPSNVRVLEGGQHLQGCFKTTPSSEETYLSQADWKRFLGHKCFRLPSRPQRTDFAEKYAPSMRSMIKYFVRLSGDNGFSYPERAFENQQRYSWQTALSYMFGFEWRIAQGFQRIRDKEKTLETLKKAAEGGVMDRMVGTVAKLRPQMVLAEQRAAKKRSEIANFQILETYRDLSDEAATYQRTMQETSRRLVTLKETFAFLNDALTVEEPASSMDVMSMYASSGVELPNLALRRFEEVETFQKSVVQNRKLHLQSEVEETGREISDANEILVTAGAARNRVLTSLQGKGAFEDLVELQRELSKLEAEHANLVERFKAAEALEGNKTELKVDRIELQRRLQADYVIHAENLNTVILRIAELISALYENREGRFEVSATDNGPEFNIQIEGDRGTGIRSMEIFCMDIALFESVTKRFGGPGFLIHDSHLFDGVDARQILTAILLGQNAVGTNGQYILTLNSDVYASLPFPESFDRNGVTIATRLSDEGESGGLFGFRFD